MKMSWKGYLKREAIAGDTRARLVLRYAKKEPGDTRHWLDDKLRRHHIDPDSHRHITERIGQLAEQFRNLHPEVLM